MKNILPLLLFTCFFVPSSVGQEELRLHKEIISDFNSFHGVYNIHSIIEYEYDAQKNIESKITTVYSSDTIINLNIPSNIFSRKGIFYTYDGENHLIKETYRTYNKNVDLWVSDYWFEYSYNSNGCLIRESYFQNVGFPNGERWRIEYERNEDCQITKETILDDINSLGVLSINYIRERIYFQDNISFQYTSVVPTDITGAFLLFNTGEIHFNSFGKEEKFLFSRYDSTSQIDYELKRESSFDINGNIISSETYKRDNIWMDWDLDSHHTYENEYDDQGRLLISNDWYTTSLSQLGVLFGNTIHEYLCKTDTFPITTYTLAYTGIKMKIEFIYEGKNDCFDIENEILEMDVFPNPSLGMITINSSIFKSGDTQVSIFDLNGRLLSVKNESRRCELIEFDLGNFPKGMYVIQLMNQDHFVQHKVLKN